MTQDMPRADTHIFQNLIFFGPFQVFVGERLLERRVPVRLARRALDILVAFAERATKVVSEDELLARVWLGRLINERTLGFHVGPAKGTQRSTAGHPLRDECSKSGLPFGYAHVVCHVDAISRLAVGAQ
jgi:hypothetical protein